MTELTRPRQKDSTAETYPLRRRARLHDQRRNGVPNGESQWGWNRTRKYQDGST
jgi:hypothetical protein